VKKLSPVKLALSSQTGNPVNQKRPFIPSTLDDFGFTSAQFRIVCRVARRGDCFEAIPKMAIGCRLSIKTVKATIRTLTNSGVFEKQPRQGQTSILRLAPFSHWRQPSPKDTPGVICPDTQPKGYPSHPAQKTPYKGNPSEGDPMKGERSSPAPKRELWQLLKDERTLKDRLQAERESVKPDQVMFESLRGQLRKVKDEIRNLPSAQNDIRNTGKPLPGENSHPDLPMSTQPHTMLKTCT
jgi:hypothetical protein